ncbi:Glyco-hydro-79C domain-containing protein [Mycena kentingensis (nom. inval.)]|nr:Glyco-hydro-79C domain-containing protein [Mycena kentingensis (nom. inval.)]
MSKRTSRRSLSLFALLLAPCTTAEITVYHDHQASFQTTSVSGAAPSEYTGLAAYSPTLLNRPELPNPGIQTTLQVALQNSPLGLSVKQEGSFVGFSVEMSVSNQVLGKNSSLIQVPFLNLMANIQQRAGYVRVRVGGNSQESAKMTDVLPDGRVLAKNLTGVTGTTQTPPLEFTKDLILMMSKISSFVNVRWFIGIPWFVTQPFELAIVQAANELLGDSLLGIQAANEPDMYHLHGHRDENYGPFDYVGEISDMLTQAAGANVDPGDKVLKKLVVPSVVNFAWTPEQVFDTGILDTFKDNIAWLSVEKYPRDNCAVAFGAPDDPGRINPQDIQNLYLKHSEHEKLLQPYLNSTLFAQSKGLPFLMFESNTGSCGGFNGISDSFTAALWGIDYALQLAHSNFTGVQFHLGGQNVFYNPFTAPPTNETAFHQWTVGPMYYSALVVAEAIGNTNATQVQYLALPGNSDSTPIYGLWENGVPKRVAIINYVDDPSGANTLNAVISIAGTTLPSSVKVKFLSADSVVQKGNYKWAGQTFGGNFESDGILKGEEEIKDVTCDTGANTCTVQVPAPGFALVFLDNDLTQDDGSPSITFSTTARTQTRNTATIDPAVLATSNGNRMSEHELAGTSKPPSAAPRAFEVSLMALGLLLGGLLVML